MANSILARMAVMISANTAELNKGLKDVSGQLKGFGSQLQGIAATVGVAFGAQQVAAFGLEVSKLAGEAEAVRTAFERLPNSIKLMNELKQATGGTVSELELMKRAVQASNFDISLEALPRLLQFATLRAQQTGQSVDYLVDSIVTGIGRRSKLILDNLGISAAQLGEELKGVSTDAASVGDVADAVGRIAEKALGNMAGFSENASTKLQRLAASWENLKVAIGTAANGTGFFGKAVDTLGNTIDVFSSDNISNLQKFQTYLIATFAPQHLAEFTKALKDADGEINKLNASLQEQKTIQIREDASLLVFLFGGVKEAVQGFREEFNNLKNIDVSTLSDTQIRTFNNFDAVMAVLQERLKKVSTAQVNQIDTISEMDAEIKRLNEKISDTNELDITSIRSNQALVSKYEERIKAIRGVTNANIELNQSELDRVKILQIMQDSLKSLPNYNSQSNLSGSMIPDITIPEEDPEARDEAFDRMTDALIEKRNKTIAILKEFNQAAWQEISSFAENSLALIGQRLGDSEINIGKGFLMGLGKFIASFGRQLVALGIGAKGLQAIIKKPLSPVAAALAIAGGAALIVAGNAISSSVSARGSELSGGGGSGISDVTRTGVNASTQNIQVTGELRLRGSDLVAAVESATQSNYYRR